MEKILTPTQMKQCDKFAAEKDGCSERILMKRAAGAAFNILISEDFDLSKVIVVCGNGNNGGDGAALAMLLHEHGYFVRLYSLPCVQMSTECEYYLNIAEKAGLVLSSIPDFTKYTTVIDAVFGIGLSRAVSGIHSEIISSINNSGTKIMSLDIPSGISASRGIVMGNAVKADVTVAFAYKKTGNVIGDGAIYSGKVITSDIGIYDEAVKGSPIVKLIDNSVINALPKRPDRSNKGTFGRLLIIAGSAGMAGAAYLSAKAAYRTGTGLVEIFTPLSNLQILQILIPEAIITTYTENSDIISILKKSLERADAIISGPGLGQNDEAYKTTEYISENSDIPTVLDADSLNIISSFKDKKLADNFIITPHPGEMSRLLKISVNDICTDIIYHALKARKKYSCAVILKDNRSVIVNDNGIFINSSGNSALAKGGTGDVLSGITGSLLAQGLSINTASVIAPYIHGKAGEKAGEIHGKRSVLASEIADCIHFVI